MFCGPSNKYDFVEYCPGAGRSSTRISGNLFKLMIIYAPKDDSGVTEEKQIADLLI